VLNRQGVRLAAVTALALAIVTLGGTADATTPTRTCGTLAVGIGWHLAATPNVTCRSARQLMATYFTRGGIGRAQLVVYRYVCSGRDLPDAEHIRCSRTNRVVTARSFGY
jgi:hypothetical protein